MSQRHNEPIEYMIPNRVIALVQIPLFVVVTSLLFPGFLTEVVDATMSGTLSNYLSTHTIEILGVLIFTAGMVAVHEYIHFLASRALGLDAKFGFRFEWSFGIPEPNPYVVTVNTLINRSQNLIVLSAPLIVLNTIALVAFALGVHPTVDYLAGVTLVLNTTFSIVDIYNTLRVATHAKGTKFSNLDTDDGDIVTYYYPPTDSSIPK